MYSILLFACLALMSPGQQGTCDRSSNTPPHTSGHLELLITDDASPGTIIEGIAAEDDGRPDPPGALRYEIVGGDADGAFAIDSRTGVLSAAKYLDAEERTDYHLQVLVSDGELATLIVIDIEVERGRLRIPGS